MGKLGEYLKRLQYLGRRKNLQRELDEEIRFHIDMKVKDLLDQGLPEDEARYAALREFGNRSLTKQDSRSPWQFGWLETFLQDVRYGLRTLTRNPIFTVAVVLTLALGIGANTAIFTLVDSVMLRVLPVDEPHELYVFGTGSMAGTMSDDQAGARNTNLISYPLYRSFREHTDVFADLAAISSFPINAYVSSDVLSSGAAVERVEARLVTGNFFRMLGVRAVVGRALGPDDDTTPGAHPVVVVSHGYWVRKFGQSPSVVGRILRMNGTEYTILGVTSPDFFGVTTGRSTDVWVPMMMQAELMRESYRLDDMTTMWMRVIGRVKEGVTEAQASTRTDDLFHRLLVEEQGSDVTPEFEEAISKLDMELMSFGGGFANLRRRFAEPLLILMGVVGLVLLIACANVGNLLLARASGRRREVALRMALGSSRGRLVRQLLTESLILALAGGAVGLLMTRWTMDILLGFLSRGASAIPLQVPLDGRVLGFTLTVSVLTALLFGLVPALRATRVDLNASLRNQATAVLGGRDGWKLRKALVVAQVAISLLLLIGAGLFLRSLANLRSQETGFVSEGVLLLEIDPRGGGYTEEQLPHLYDDLVERIESIPQVRSASLSLFHLFRNARWRTAISIDDYSPQKDEDLGIEATMVTPGYFETVGAPVILGRPIAPKDRDGAPKVVVVNETFARHFFGEESPLGKRFGIDGDESSRDLEIVGVAKDIVYYNYRDETPRFVYFPVMQTLDYLESLEVRTAGDPTAVIPLVRQAVNEAGENLPIVEVKTLDEQIDRSLRDDKLVSQLTSFFGLLALLLASIGLYGVLAYGVAQRTNEIGIRIALGAGRVQVLWMILRDGMVLVGLGILIGIPASLATTRLASSLLFGLGAADVWTMFGATLVLCLVALFAGYLPAWKASRLDPSTSLRYE